MKVQYRSSDSNQLFETNIKEHVIWKNEVITRAVRQKVIETQIITNLRVLQNNSYFFLHTLNDIVVMNQHRESQYRRQMIHSRRSPISHKIESRTTIGDVVFIYRGRPVIVFKQIVDPYTLSKLANNTRLNLVSLLKNAERNTETKVPHKDMEMTSDSNPYPTKRMRNRSLDSNVLRCNECGVPLVKDSNFCNSCGTKVSFLCLNCNQKNPPSSAFCNNCGYALT